MRTRWSASSREAGSPRSVAWCSGSSASGFCPGVAARIGNLRDLRRRHAGGGGGRAIRSQECAAPAEQGPRRPPKARLLVTPRAVCQARPRVAGLRPQWGERKTPRLSPPRSQGKLEVVPTKPMVSPIDLSLAYTPGVAEPCLDNRGERDMSWEYTARANLVAVISNGTAVLGLGAIGPAAGKPVMEARRACSRICGNRCLRSQIAEKNATSSSTSSPRSSRRSGGSTSRTSRRRSASRSRRSCASGCASRCFTMTSTAPHIFRSRSAHAAELASKQPDQIKLVVSRAPGRRDLRASVLHAARRQARERDPRRFQGCDPRRA